MWTTLKRLVDRDVHRWRGRSMLLFTAVVPIILLDLAFDGPPSRAPIVLLVIALATSTLIGAFVLWRALRWEWLDVRRIRALAKQEEADKPKR